MRALLLLLAVALVAAGVYIAGVVLGWYGVLYGPGTLTQQAIPAEVVKSRALGDESRAGTRRREADPVRRPPRPHHLLDRRLSVDPSRHGR